MMNRADLLFLIISLSLLMSSRTEKSFNLLSSLSLSLPPSLPPSQPSSFSRLNILNFLPLFAWHLISVLLSCPYHSCMSSFVIIFWTFHSHQSRAFFSGPSGPVSFFISIHFSSGRGGKQEVFKGCFISQFYSQHLSWLFFPAASAQVWSLFLSKRLREKLDWSVCVCECGSAFMCDWTGILLLTKKNHEDSKWHKTVLHIYYI